MNQNQNKEIYITYTMIGLLFILGVLSYVLKNKHLL